jgi:O-antigen/teichoic acid export membrane protein
LTQVGCQLCTQTILGFLRFGPLGLLLGDVIGRSSGCLSLARLLRLRGWETFRSIRWDTMWAAAVRYRRFPLVSSGSALLNIAAYALPTLLIAQLYGPRTLGWFALGDRVLGVPATLIGQAVSQVYSVEAASLSTSNPSAMHALFVRSVKRLALLGAAPFLILFLLSPPLFGFVFGASWREAGVYTRLLALMHYLAFISWPLSPTLSILEQQYWQLGWDAGRLVLTCGSLWLAFQLGSSTRMAIGTLGAAMFVGYAAHLMLSEWAIRNKVRQVRSDAAAKIATSEYAELGKL